MATTSLVQAYRACAVTTRNEARNFYYAFLSLPKPQRQAVYALYAFCREVDDVADAVNPLDSLTENAASPLGSLTEKRDEATLLLGGLVDAVSPLDSLTEKRDEAALLLGGLTNAASPLGSLTENAVSPLGSLTEKRGGAAFLSGRVINAGDPLDGNGGEGVLVARKREGLRRFRERLRLAAEDRPGTLPDHALADTIHRFGVDVDDLGDVITGVEMDLESHAFKTFDDLRTYCYYVASAVGLATLPILNDGVPPTDAMRECAVGMGLGMQLVNILRDVAEDLARGRIYLPADELARFAVAPEDLDRGVMTDQMRSLLAFQADRARQYIDEGRGLIPLVPRCSRGCLWLLTELYGRILARIVAADYDLFRGRVSLSAREKLALLASTLWRRL